MNEHIPPELKALRAKLQAFDANHQLNQMNAQKRSERLKLVNRINRLESCLK